MPESKIEITIGELFGIRYTGTDKVAIFYPFRVEDDDVIGELDENQLGTVIDALEGIHRSIMNRRFAEEQKNIKCNCKIE